MKTNTKIFAAMLSLILLTGCSANAALTSSLTGTDSGASGTATAAAASTDSPLAVSGTAVDSSDMFTSRDLSGEYADYVTITLADGAATASGSGVTVEGDTVTITEAGSYLVTGTLTNGQLKVAAPDDAKVQLVLSDASITCEGSAALFVLTADKVFLTTAKGTENALVSTGDYLESDEANIDGAIFSKTDLTINGYGDLTVKSETGHGIVVKDDLKITGSTLTVIAAKDGIQANNSVRVSDGIITITAGSDGIEADHESSEKGYIYIAGGTFTIDCAGDALKASSTVAIEGGSFDLTAGGGATGSKKASGDLFGGWGARGTTTTASSSDSAKAIKADIAIEIAGGAFTISAADDAIHSNGDITIYGGTFDITTDDDAVHADDTLTITGGAFTVDAHEGLEASVITIEGGEFDLTCDDDGINASGGSSNTLTISGGVITLNCEGDALDANGTLSVTGGEITIAGPSNGGNGILDYDASGTITGGTLIATGVSGMQINFGASSTQGSILYTFNSAQAAGTAIVLSDADGKIIAQYTAEKSFSVVLVSSPAIEAGETYTLTVGGTDYTIEMTSLLYGASNGMGMGGMMGGQGGFGGQTPPDMGSSGSGGFGGNPGGRGGRGGFGG